MHFNKHLGSIFVMSMLFATAAHAEVYNCTLTDYGEGGFIPSSATISIKDGVAVYQDPFVDLSLGERGVSAEINNLTSKRISFKYRLTIPLQSGAEGSLQYTATYFRNSNKLNIRAILSGYDNNITGSGRCVRIK